MGLTKTTQMLRDLLAAILPRLSVCLQGTSETQLTNVLTRYGKDVYVDTEYCS